ncbi:MAG: hypothetical protein IAE85_01315 [Anaerolinea sp.]|nr:hypothetical protein [Anaerolinea sp.]
MLLPHAEQAVVDIRKLRDYCLNPLHDEGKHKAKLFVAALGMTAKDAYDLREMLLDAVLSNDAVMGRQDKYGQRYIVDFGMVWHNRRATVRSAWIIENGSTTPRLTSCYPL